MQKKLRKFPGRLKSFFTSLLPGAGSLRAAAKALLYFTCIAYVVSLVIVVVSSGDPWFLLPGLLFPPLFWLAAKLFMLVIKLLNGLPRLNVMVLLCCFPLMVLGLRFDPLLSLIMVVLLSLFGAGYYVVVFKGFRNFGLRQRVTGAAGLLLGLAGLSAGLFFYVKRGMELKPQIINAAGLNASQIAHLAGSSPATEGKYAVKTLTYGSGADKHRKAFGAGVTIKTKSVNGVAFLDNWSGFAGWWRKMYWGFDAKALPVNGRVWYPEGRGPFPLVLVVHGNHLMTDFSDPGYDYLGKLLASRGMIVASVDQNFINGNWSDLTGGLKKENDARGWLLLEHLSVWHQWNADKAALFYGKVDTGKIALIGHSRGGEAVAHAALFNSLHHYPDDASVKLDYHYRLKGIIAIAPVDGQYQPAESLTGISDVDYLTLHGAQDGDVTTYMGSMQFERVHFSGSEYHFKAGLYVYGANHGQFNTTWGDNDHSLPFKGLFNRQQMMTAADQQQVAKVYISAFLEASLNGRHQYLPLFTDARHGRNWLPQSIYLNQFEDANTRYLAAFDEDFDVATGTGDSVVLGAENLTVWREQEIKLKNGRKGSRAAYLGWHYNREKADPAVKRKIRDWVADSLIAAYTVNIQPGSMALDTSSVLVFSMAESKEESNPKASGKWVGGDEVKAKEKKKVEKKKEEIKKQEEDKDKKVPQPLDLTIELTDQQGQVIRFPLSRFSALQRELEVRIMKMDFLKGKKESERVFQKFSFPLAELQKLNPSFLLQYLKQIRFVFDRTENGVVVMDNVGFMKRLDLVDMEF